jgi:hypothetical protein
VVVKKAYNFTSIFGIFLYSDTMMCGYVSDPRQEFTDCLVIKNGWSQLWWLFEIRIGPAQCTTLSKLSRKYSFNGSRVQPTVLI